MSVCAVTMINSESLASAFEFGAPSSSPPSSPVSTIIDSSPAPSPIIDAYDGNPSPPPLDLQPSPAHPFSASTRSSKAPPRYEKKPASPATQIRHATERFIARPLDYTRPFSFSRAFEDDEYIHDLTTSTGRGLRGPDGPTFDDPERSLWTETIADAIDNALCKIDLNDRGLTYIPSSISDLGNLVVLPSSNESRFNPSRVLARSMTGVSSPGRTLAQTRSFNASRTASSFTLGVGGVGTRQEEIHLYLGNNHIQFLPNEIFRLDALVVLSLRGNALTELPPHISQLKNLRELNVALNKLVFLPSELMDLKLTKLAVHPNPFISAPRSGTRHPVSEVSGRSGRVTTLVELALRVLLSPASTENSDESGVLPHPKPHWKTQLEALYDVRDLDISPALYEVLTACVPNFFAASVQTDVTPRASPAGPHGMHLAGSAAASRSQACISTCSAPHHREFEATTGYRRPVFVAHAEERYTWEDQVAGVQISGAGGDGVPVRWRGCGWGCLDYLCESGVVEDGDGWDVGAARMEVEQEVTSGTCGPSEVPFSSEDFEFDDED